MKNVVNVIVEGGIAEIFTNNEDIKVNLIDYDNLTGECSGVLNMDAQTIVQIEELINQLNEAKTRIENELKGNKI